MKNLIIVIILGVAGYFAYQYFIGSSQQVSTTARPTFNMYSLPEKCQRAGENMKDAFYRRQKGEFAASQVNGFKVSFRRCLRRAGLTASQIDEAYDGIADSADYSSW
jgi:hypothetical protein